MRNKVIKHYACLMKGGKIISAGISTKGGCGGFRRCRTCHAEINCLKNLPEKFYRKKKTRQLTIYSLRWSADGKLTSAMPCIHCVNSLLASGIKKCVYSDDEGELIKCNLLDIITKCKLTSGERKT